MIKVIATDIDGTITDSTRKICIEVINAFRKLEDRGIKIILVSGNVLPVMLAYRTFIGTTGPVIAENGGIMLYNNVIYKYFDIAPILDAYNYLKQHMPEAKRILTDRWRETSVVLDPALNVEQIRNILENFNLRIESTGYGIHIMAKTQNKFFGVKKAIELLNIAESQVLAIGDSENDVEMIKFAGIGAVVANAWEVVKRHATIIAEKPGGAGVVEILHRLELL